MLRSRHFPLPFKEGAPLPLFSFRKEAFFATPTFTSRSASFYNSNKKGIEAIAGSSSRSDSPKKKKGNQAMEAQVPTEPLSKVQKLSSDAVNGGAKHSLGCPALLVKKLSPHAILPSRGSALAAGYDLSSAYDDVVPARGKALVKTDLSIAIPEGTYARVAPRSGLAWKHAIDVGAGVIDADYRGSVGVILFNHSDQDFTIKAGDRIAQLILEKIAVPNVVEVDDLDATARGEGGFGSTGVNTTL